MLRRSFVLIFALMMLIVSCAQAESGSFQTIIEPLYDETTAYILNAPVPPEKPGMAHDIVNILMIGVDYGILTSGRGKEDIKNCHTDCVMMIALDRTAKRISLISIPRDTITYVPGVRGVYKLNNAFNCAGTLEEGIQSTVNTVTWLMGGIRPDHYLLITPHLVELIGDAIGGLDIDVEMRYTGHSGTPYQKGFQHLNGVGIMDYSRARKNATVNNNDYGRTNRQRVVMTALIEKVSGNQDLSFDILNTLVDNYGSWFFSDMSAADLQSMLPLVTELAHPEVGRYIMNGEKVVMAMKYFAASFFDQAHRQDIIREVYGIEVPQLRQYSQGYFNYLTKYAFPAVKAVYVGARIIDWAKKNSYNGSALPEAEGALKELVDAISEVDDRLEQKARNHVDKKLTNLKLAVKKLRDDSGCTIKLSWKIEEKEIWYLDPDIEQYNHIDWS